MKMSIKKSKSNATQPIRDKKQVQALINHYLHQGQIRNYTLITMGIYTALRISDLLRLTWGDVYNFNTKCIRQSITITESKTNKTKTIALHENCINALKRCLHTARPTSRLHPLFENKQNGQAISRVQAYRIIREASEELELDIPASCHSLRKTFGYHAWKEGISPAVIMEIYNHSSLSVTRRYLGVSQDDKNEVYLGLVI